ncbi:FkbM family methyltransferase [Mucilaginibacter sp. UYNi724]
MRWKLLAGQILEKSNNLIINSGLNFVDNNYPYGKNWVFDLKRLLPGATTIFDIGAHAGSVSLELNNSFPNADIIAFEPVSASFDRFKANTVSIYKIKGYQLAAGNEADVLEIPIYSESTINTLKNAEYSIPPIGNEKITVIRLDEFANKNNISHIDILKIDVEGYELEALRGVGNFLQQVKYVYAEIGFERCPTKTHFTDMDVFMEQHGFRLVNIYELQHHYIDRTRLSYANALYVKK